jgi:hypothetical protein
VNEPEQVSIAKDGVLLGRMKSQPILVSDITAVASEVSVEQAISG